MFQKKKLTKEQKEVRALKAQLPLAKPKKRGMENHTVAQLMSPTGYGTKWHSRYIRLRDSTFNGREWVGECIDQCGRQLVVVDADGKWTSSTNEGHFISRSVYSLRYNELNTNLQGAWCNAWRDKEDMQEGYRRGLALKYGEDTVDELKRLSKLPDAYKKPSKAEILSMIADCKEYVEYRLAHANGHIDTRS